MKNEIQAMSLRKIKWILKIRLISLLSAVFFIILMIALSFGISLMHWSGPGSILAVVTCVILTLASFFEYLVLNKRLASGGL
jgi:hypothetical protein